MLPLIGWGVLKSMKQPKGDCDELSVSNQATPVCICYIAAS